jgi:hypothetical protein
MQSDDEAGNALEEVNRIRPAVDRLRAFVASVTALDLQATSRRYWSEPQEEGERAITSP